MNLSLQKEIRKLGRLSALALLVTVSILSFAVTAGYHHTQSRLARSYMRATKFSLVTSDFRQALISLHPALEDGFKAIAVRSGPGELIAGLPRNSAVEQGFGPFDVRITLPILSDDEGGRPPLAVLDFHYSIGPLLLFLLATAALVSFMIRWFFRRSLRNLQLRHEKALRLEKAEARATLANQVSHDIRSPLSALEAVVRNLEIGDDESKTLAVSAMSRIRLIADDLLDRNRSEAGSTAAFDRWHSIDMTKILNDLFNEKMLEHRDSRVVFERQIVDGLREELKIAPKEISSMVSNLVNNAVEAMPGGGRLTLQLREYKAKVVISVADTGIGIREEDMNRIGTPGFTTKNGNGLGLSSARSVLEKAGDRLEIFSKAGAGTVVTLHLHKKTPTPDPAGDAQSSAR